jgi:hypothetical protein
LLDIIHDVIAVPELLQAIGVFGFLLYMGSFLAIQNGNICGNGIIFPTVQIVAALCVLLSLAAAFNLASFLIQISYVAIGLYGVCLRLRMRSRGEGDRPAAGTPA